MAVLIKNVPERTWRAFKAEAARRGMTVGELFADMVREHLSEKAEAERQWRTLVTGAPTLAGDEAEKLLRAMEEFREGFRFDDDRA